MFELYSIFKDIPPINNAKMVVDIKNKIDNIFQLLYEINKNKITINLYCIKNLYYKFIRINNINNKFNKLIENKNYGIVNIIMVKILAD